MGVKPAWTVLWRSMACLSFDQKLWPAFGCMKPTKKRIKVCSSFLAFWYRKPKTYGRNVLQQQINGSTNKRGNEMQAETKISDLQLIATELKKDSRIASVYLEYLGYLSVVINESTDLGVSFGYDPEDEDTDLYWNDFGAFSGNWHNGLRVNGNFPNQETPSKNAQMLITQLEQAGYLK